MTPQEQWILQKERALSCLRVGFAVVALIVVQLNPSRVARFPVLSTFSLWSFFVYTLLAAYVARAEQPGSGTIGWISTCLDLIWLSLIIFSTGGARTPFFFYYSFPVIAASARWGISVSILIAVISDAMYGAIRFAPIVEATD